ncbi:hypothetical protein ABIB57_004922 [Devosia sp. UYZn731]|uniref:caspase family protein n=1 Tax=Devosia sp. UYZn731 TaxID=3156345 RepID=UPI003394CE84
MIRGVLVAIAMALSLASAAAQERVALVIGNGAYTHVAPLTNPENDATDVADALGRIGFTVTLANDLNANQMRAALHEFSSAASGADMAMIYYAGHGIEIDKQNYLIPVDAALESDRDVSFETIPIDLLNEAVSGARTLRMVLLDACRNNPFAAQMTVTGANRSVGRGLTPPELGGGTLVAYSAKGGTVALDGNGRNSPFAKALLDNIEVPGLEINFLFRKVRDSVLTATLNRQEPFVYGSLPGEYIYLVPPTDAAVAAGPTVPADLGQPVPAPSAQEDFAWSLVQNSEDQAQLQQFIYAYPRGIHIEAALERMQALDVARAASGPTSADVGLVPTVQAAAPVAGSESPAELSPDVIERVMSIQQVLADAGCDPGPVDGDWASLSQAALARYGAEAGSKPPELPDAQMLAWLQNNAGLACPVTSMADADTLAPDFSPDNLDQRCAEIYRNWNDQFGAKAFAWSEQGQDCGSSWSNATLEEARSRALSDCGIAGCVVVAQDQNLAAFSLFANTVLVRECVLDYRHWNDQSSPKSFYASEDGYNCGAASGEVSLTVAREEALRQCEKEGQRCRELGFAE